MKFSVCVGKRDSNRVGGTGYKNIFGSNENLPGVGGVWADSVAHLIYLSDKARFCYTRNQRAIGVAMDVDKH